MNSRSLDFMATAQRSRRSSSDPGPTIFVLFGGTGDLAKRLVLPAFYRLALEGVLPKRWLLVGNGRGDVAHEDFRAHIHAVLTQFGPHPEPGPWEAFAQRVFFAGGGFSTEEPGSLLDVLAKKRAALGGDPQLVHYFAVPPVAFAGLTKALGVRSSGGGFGLFSVREQINRLGGTVEIISTPGQGTHVNIRVPLNTDGSPTPVDVAAH